VKTHELGFAWVAAWSILFVGPALRLGEHYGDPRAVDLDIQAEPLSRTVNGEPRTAC
jgi:hypothetical protein